jgi:hypothetical protein
MRNRASTILAAAVLTCLLPGLGQAQLTPYSQDFELLDQADIAALDNDGWLVFGNVYAPDGTTYLYGYGPFPAPNDGAAFCAIDLLQGGTEQGLQQLSVYSDYNNTDHAVGNIIESNVYQEQTIGAENEGETWVFAFQSKMGNLDQSINSTAAAFIKTLDPNNGFELTNFFSEDMTNIPDTWGGTSISISIDASLVGQVLQFGFLNRATNYEDSGIYYDNIDFDVQVVGIPDRPVIGTSLGQNYPNPFNPTTRIEFSMERAGDVQLVVYDLAGRKVATLQDGPMELGEHSVTWNGRSDSGAAVASGRYTYVLQTPDARIARSMTLLK